MTLAEALGIMLPHLKDELAVHANGMISRAAAAVRDRPANFYMLGSMGLASSIGLGLALAQPRRRIVVFDGDGNVLMNLGALAMGGALKPLNYLHICLDNGAYASTGNQRAISQQVQLETVAAAAGYVAAVRVDTPAALATTFREWLAADGPRFLLVRIELDTAGSEKPRVAHQPTAIAQRFRTAACGEATAWL